MLQSLVTLFAAFGITVQLGRFPILAPLGNAVGKCNVAAAPPELRAHGVATVYILSFEGEPSRYVSASTTTSGSVSMVTVFYSVAAVRTRREGERVFATFSTEGELINGTRAYRTTGTPSTRSEDRSQPLTKEDAALTLGLAKEAVKRCAK
jgi:hypothetical protein